MATGRPSESTSKHDRNGKVNGRSIGNLQGKSAVDLLKRLRRDVISSHKQTIAQLDGAIRAASEK